MEPLSSIKIAHVNLLYAQATFAVSAREISKDHTGIVLAVNSQILGMESTTTSPAMRKRITRSEEAESVPWWNFV